MADDELTEKDQRWLAECTQQILLASIDRRHSYIAQLVSEIGTRHGHLGVYVLCSALASTIVALGEFDQSAPFHGFAVHNPATGEAISPEDPLARDSYTLIHATRFVVAHLNDDEETKGALYTAHPQLTPMVLAKLAGAYGRAREEEHRSKETP